MNVSCVQRWAGGRASYRPAGEPIDIRRYEVASIDSDAIAKAYVVSRHYSASYPAARFRIGLYRGTSLVGVAVFSVPCNERALAALPGEGLERIELGRFILDDDVEANGESWFIARCFEILRREGITGVLAFSDPMPRTDVDGAVIFPGHIGTIYKATNAVYAGRGTARTLRLLPDGSVLSDRAVQKLRRRERGWRYVSGLLARHGAPTLGLDEDPARWLQTWVPRCTRALRHPGNHRYLWALNARDRRYLPAGLAYPMLESGVARTLTNACAGANGVQNGLKDCTGSPR